MGTLLIDHWLGTSDRIENLDDASVSEVRERIRALGASAGLDGTAIENLAAAASELARNQLAHAIRGTIGVHGVTRDGSHGVEVIAADRGPGIPDPTAALSGVPRPTGSLGVGLSAALRLTGALDLDIREGSGTCVRIRAFARPTTPRQVGIFARAHPDETVIGDHAAAIRTGDALVLAVADGLGHGPAAMAAAERVIDVVVAHPERPLDALLAEAHAAAVGTRGAVMSIAKIGGGFVEHAGIGNIGARVLGSGGVAHPLGNTAGTLGSAMPRRVPVERVALAPGELVVMFSDGILTRVDLTAEPVVMRQHPAAIAHYLHAHFTRGNDDALVAVVR